MRTVLLITSLMMVTSIASTEATTIITKRMTGVHLKVAVYHVSYIVHKSWFDLKRKKMRNSFYFIFPANFNDKETTNLLYQKRDPNNASVVHYSGVPKDIFDLLAASSLNFT